LSPRQDRVWADDVAQRLQVVEFDGSRVVLANVRHFTWRTDDDHDVHWERREYDLDQLRSADLVLSYWMGPMIAHTLVSFGFADGRQLVFSLAIRKERGESFSALGGFFRKFEMTLVAAEETDIVRVRSNVRGEDVYLYRLKGMTRDQLKDLFVSYLGEARKLDAAPAFYNTLTSNCTTIVYELAKQIAPGLPLDYRLLASGYFAEYARDLGVLTPGVDFAT
ncbi:Lnb N-terminal periplasmic domain-containing protein, partial [Listeria monocytogenes]|uniref:Lnb N-terminal periplasmic domain-containing protein n=1 Tax=Listeria monocytogenes TaxID=1639 RepID=UPI00112F555E